MSKIKAIGNKEYLLDRLDRLQNYCRRDVGASFMHLIKEVKDGIDTLTSELEAERKAKEEAIRLLISADGYLSLVGYRKMISADIKDKEDIEKELIREAHKIRNFTNSQTHTVSKGDADNKEVK